MNHDLYHLPALHRNKIEDISEDTEDESDEKEYYHRQEVKTNVLIEPATAETTFDAFGADTTNDNLDETRDG